MTEPRFCLTPRVGQRKEDLYLVHACVGEEQGGVIQRDGGGGVDIGVLISFKEIYKPLSDLSCC